MRPVELARAYGTPAYHYELADVRRAYAQLRAVLPVPSLLYYSLKANPHPDLATVLARLGCRAEVSSAGELATALAAGFAPAAVLLTGPGKTGEDIGYALAQGVRRFSVESPADLARVGELACAHGRAVDCLLRVNADTPVPGMGLAMAGTASQFGADASWVLSEPERFRGAGQARVTGLHLYMGTNLPDPQVLAAELTANVVLAGQLRARLGVPLTEVDLGGGFGMPYARSGPRPAYPDLAARLEPVLDAELAGWRQRRPQLSFESGRYLVGGCGTLVCRVLDVKRSKGRTFVVLDTGVHHLGGMSGLRRLPRMVPDLLPDGGQRELVADCVVAGQLCTPLDTWSDGVALPLLREGDLVAVPNVGGYGLTASLLGFLGHRPAVEVVTDVGAVVSATRLALDRVPEPAGASPNGATAPAVLTGRDRN